MDDVLNDALSNLEHDNYELSYEGYENRQADIALIRAALAAQKADDALRRLVDEKFSSGNAIPVERITITRQEYAATAQQRKENDNG